MSFNTPQKKFEEIHVPKILFLGEQDGRPERLLKIKLTDFFSRDKSVTKAYLARVDIGDGKTINVILGLRAQFGADKGLVEKIGNIFNFVFNSEEHLDIIFLTDNQETDLKKVCKPFFERA